MLPISVHAQAKRAPTAADAKAFIASAEARLTELALRANQAGWVAATYITDDTEALNAEASKNYAVAVQQLALDARRFDKVKLSPELRRKFTLLRLGLAAPPPGNPGEAAELTRITTSMEADYGKGTYCRQAPKDSTRASTGGAAGSDCLQISELSRILVDSRDPATLLDAWQGWHRVGAPMRQRYARFVTLSNKGARELGFADAGAMWRSNYDMPPDQFAKEVDRLWEQVKPLYVALHAYVRARLVQQYGPRVVPANGMIPAHLLGNMWAQEWGNIYPIVAPQGAAPTYDIGALLRAKHTDVKGMVKYGEGFFTSMGFAPMPATFWERSQFTKPRDREVVCHASAWDIDDRDDLRVKMCLDVTTEDFITAHHEIGHNFYQRAYKDQPFLFKGGANDGFHEAIGDAIALSITPSYLQQVGLLDASAVPGPEADIPLLLRQAMDKVAFLPFGLLVDKWRWQVFSGETTPASYNKDWWDLRARYQGVAPPMARSEADFDPGAKYHVPANTPYMRYFLARVLQFQFYRAMCQASGYKGPLHRCSFYGSKEAGARLNAMLEAGQSEPWPETLYKLTGSRQLDASAITEYFAPLKTWLDQQNAGKPVGW